MKHLILIHGLKRSGKDYTAKIIKEILGDEVSSVSYADPLKQIIADTFGITLEELEDYKNDGEGVYLQEAKLDGYDCKKITDFRIILQRFGTEAMKKQFGDDVWAKRGFENATKQGTDIVVIPDFRFMIEHETAVSDSRFFGNKIHTIHVQNKDLPTADSHASERELSDNNFKFDYYIDNTGQPLNIKTKVQEILKAIL